jgi:hypothetical protein
LNWQRILEVTFDCRNPPSINGGGAGWRVGQVAAHRVAASFGASSTDELIAGVLAHSKFRDSCSWKKDLTALMSSSF